jgi:ribosome-associated protein
VPSDPHDAGESRRQIARRQRRNDGDQSAFVSRTLMQLSDSAIARLGLDAELRAEVDRARGTTSNVARRREERRLAGALRRFDLDDLEVRIANIRETGSAAPQQLHQAEAWRARLLDEGAEGLAAFVARFKTMPAQLGAMIEGARSERSTGKPRGAGRALFRQIAAIIGGVVGDGD